MKITHCALVGAVFLLVCLEAEAQRADMREGYIVIGKDTTKGWLDYKGNKESAELCTFSSTRRGTSKDYGASEIAGYGFKDGKYFEAINLPDNAGAVFGKVMARGAMNLFRVDDVYYVVKDDSVVLLPLPVTKPVTVKDASGRDVTMSSTSKQYVAILNYLMRDCSVIIDAPSYSENSLAGFVNWYNQCRGIVIEDRNKRKAFEVSFNISGGYYSSSMSIDSIPSATNLASTSAFGGIGLEIGLPRVYDKISLLVNFQYSRAFYQGSSSLAQNGRFYQDDLLLKVDYVKIPVGARYYFGSPGRSPFINAGGYLSHATKIKFTAVRESNYNNLISTWEGTGARLRGARGLFVGVGYEYRIASRFRAFAEVRVDRGTGFFGTRIQPNSKVINYIALAGIKF